MLQGCVSGALAFTVKLLKKKKGGVRGHLHNMKPNTIHSQDYCIKRIAEIKEKNKGKEMPQSDVLILNNFEKILQQYKEHYCGEHYFLDDGKWSSTRSCQFCGKKINN